MRASVFAGTPARFSGTLGWSGRLRFEVLIPGERPLVGIVAKYMTMLCAVVLILTVMIAVGSHVFLFPIYLAMFGGLWIRLRGLA